MRQISLSLFALAALVLAPVVVGCAESEDVDGTGRGDTSGNGGEGTITGAGGEDPTGGDGGSGATGGTGPEVCPDAKEVYEAKPAPSNVLFLFDRSGSMHLTVDGATTRWQAAEAGLFELIDNLPADTNAGIEMFPRGDQPITCCAITADNDISCDACGSGELPGPGARCDEAKYMTPAVPVGPLDPSQRKKMKDHVSSADDEFYWGTPMAPALDGAVQYQVGKAAAGVSSVILITDGNPTSCDTTADPSANDIQRVADAAAAGLAAAAPVRTFVIGVIDGDGGVLGASEANMSLIAEAGGTPRYAGCEANADCAYPVNTASFAVDMKAALDAIALQAFSCTFDVPEVQGGDPDYDAVNITLTADNQTSTIAKDTTHENGWDYLPGHQSVQLYGEACEALKADATATVQVVVGCKTVGQ